MTSPQFTLWVPVIPRILKRWSWLLLALCGHSPAGIRLRAVLADTAFPAPGPYRLEVLETGDSLQVIPGHGFFLQLPSDTLWTLCVQRVSGSGEKCFEVRYRGPDSAFTAILEGS